MQLERSEHKILSRAILVKSLVTAIVATSAPSYNHLSG
jgi:hypothetical protein